MNRQQMISVTVGRGFIGLNLIPHLSGFSQVQVFDRLERSLPTGWFDGDSNLIVGKILDEVKLRDSMENTSTLEDGLAATWEWFVSQKDQVQNAETTDS